MASAQKKLYVIETGTINGKKYTTKGSFPASKLAKELREALKVLRKHKVKDGIEGSIPLLDCEDAMSELYLQTLTEFFTSKNLKLHLLLHPDLLDNYTLTEAVEKLHKKQGFLAHYYQEEEFGRIHDIKISVGFTKEEPYLHLLGIDKKFDNLW